MRPSIWTGMYPKLPLAGAVRSLREHGWKVFEISTEHLVRIDDGDTGEQVEAALAVTSELEVSTPQAHAYLQADVTHPDEAQREEDVARLIRHIGIAADLGSKVVVMHPGRGLGCTTRDQRKRHFDLNVRAFTRLTEAASARGVKIAVENMMDGGSVMGRRRYGGSPHELIELVDAVGSPDLGVCLDTSHANVQRLDIPAMIAEVAPVLFAVHISDNDGSGDQHRIPGGGAIQWDGVVDALRGVDFRYDFNLEIPGDNSADPDERRNKSVQALAKCRELLGV